MANNPMADETSPVEEERQNQLAIVVVDLLSKTAEPRIYEGTVFGLPRGWMAEIRPRKASSKSCGKMDLFFYEPGTRRQFRSLKAVKKHVDLDVRQTSRNRKPKASKAASQFENLNENDKFESKAADQSENVDEKNRVGSSSKVGEEDKDEDNYHCLDKISKRIRWQLINGKQNSWDLYVKVPAAVQEQWMDMFLKPDNYNRESNPPGMK